MLEYKPPPPPPPIGTCNGYPWQGQSIPFQPIIGRYASDFGATFHIFQS